MKRIVALITLAGLMLCACVQGGTVYVDGEGYKAEVSAISPNPAEDGPAPTPVLSETISNGTLNEPVIKATPSDTNGATMPAQSATPGPSFGQAPSADLPDQQNNENKQNGQSNDKVLPELVERLYFSKLNTFPQQNIFEFNGAAFSKQDLKLLCVLLNLQQWKSINDLLGAFGAKLEPDIRYIDFINKDTLNMNFQCSIEPDYDEGAGYATITLDHTDGSILLSYMLVFEILDDSYYPSCVIKIEKNNANAKESGYRKIGDMTFYSYMQQVPLNSLNYAINEKLYSLRDGKLLLSYYYKSDRGYQNIFEANSTAIDFENIEQLEGAYLLHANQNAVIKVGGLEEPFELKCNIDFNIYFDTDNTSFYTDLPYQLLFMDTGKIDIGQYKYLFSGDLISLANSPAQTTRAWAKQILETEDSQRDLPKMPESKTPIFRQSQHISSQLYYSSTSLSEQRLDALCNDIRNKRDDSLLSLLKMYGVELYTYSDETYDIQWNKADSLICTLDFVTAREREVYLDIRYKEGRKNKGVLLACKLKKNTWEPYVAYWYDWTNKYQDGPEWYYHKGILEMLIPVDYKNGYSVWENTLISNGAILSSYICGYLGKDKIVYQVYFDHDMEQGNFLGMGMLYVTAKHLEGTAPILTYEIPVWREGSELFTGGEDIAPLLNGETETYPLFMDALNKILSNAKENGKEN